MNVENTNITNDVKDAQHHSTPDDRGNIHLDCYVKIFDPNSKETLVEVRE